MCTLFEWADASAYWDANTMTTGRLEVLSSAAFKGGLLETDTILSPAMRKGFSEDAEGALMAEAVVSTCKLNDEKLRRRQ